MSYAARTKVPVEKSRLEIERVLKRLREPIALAYSSGKPVSLLEGPAS